MCVVSDCDNTRHYQLDVLYDIDNIGGLSAVSFHPRKVAAGAGGTPAARRD